MSRKLQLRLVSSPEMGERGENDIIRFPRSVRERLGIQAYCSVHVGTGDYRTELNVGKARRSDLKRLSRMLSTGRISKEEASCAGFVTKTVQQRVSRHRDGDELWLSAAGEHITIGADPEFGLVDSHGILIRGDDVLPGEDSPFGSDGPGAEVRPYATDDHCKLVNNIQAILETPPPLAEAYNWVGGATYTDRHRKYWFGGHIHLGRPKDLKEELAPACYAGIARALDHLVALPLVRLDTPNPTYRRNGCKYGYGKAGTLDSGGSEASIRTHADRFEYRVLSGLWLTHPDLAKITLGVTKCVAEDAYARAAAMDYDPSWAMAPPSRKGLAKALKLVGTREVLALINNADPASVTADHLKVWEKQLRELDSYDDYKSEIEALIALVKHVPESFNLDLKKTWLGRTPLLSKAPKQLQDRLEEVAGK